MMDGGLWAADAQPRSVFPWHMPAAASSRRPVWRMLSAKLSRHHPRSTPCSLIAPRVVLTAAHVSVAL